MLEAEDLLRALIIEREVMDAFFGLSRNRPPSTILNLSQITDDLLASVEALSARSEPLPRGSEMPLSESIKQVFKEAKRLQEELQQRSVEPLHLLAAVLADQSSKAVQISQQAGITREGVLKILRERANVQPLITPSAPTPIPVTATPSLYSSRTRNVNYLARLRARLRGSVIIELEDLLTALLIEDQGGFPQALAEARIGIDITHVDLRPHPPAFAAKLADDLISRIQALCRHDEPLPLDASIPLSTDCQRAFTTANLLRIALGRREITVLHLLAATLTESGKKPVQVFLEAGITAELALNAAKNTEDPPAQ